MLPERSLPTFTSLTSSTFPGIPCRHVWHDRRQPDSSRLEVRSGGIPILLRCRQNRFWRQWFWRTQTG